MSFDLDPVPSAQAQAAPHTSVVLDDPTSTTCIVRAALADSSTTDLIWLVGARETIAVARAIKSLERAIAGAWLPQTRVESTFRMVSHRVRRTVDVLGGRRSPLRRIRHAQHLARRGHEIGADLRHLVELRDELTLTAQGITVAQHELVVAVGDLQSVITALQDGAQAHNGAAVRSRVSRLGVELVIAQGALGGADVRLGQLRTLARTIETCLEATARLAAALDLAVALRIQREPSARLTEIDPIVTNAVEQVRAEVGGSKETIGAVEILRLLGPVPSALDGRLW
ncbi:hypothetical protein [Cellulosimicrobium cellulans]|uniref:hypothetical protein n=1 Tax=Cellulosimicrobium cellulans TaxID=1710 RepID=UPI0005BDFE72|nr:hypothetical protein [Cellulosimicrobium cellulans]